MNKNMFYMVLMLAGCSSLVAMQESGRALAGVAAGLDGSFQSLLHEIDQFIAANASIKPQELAAQERSRAFELAIIRDRIQLFRREIGRLTDACYGALDEDSRNIAWLSERLQPLEQKVDEVGKKCEMAQAFGATALLAAQECKCAKKKIVSWRKTVTRRELALRRVVQNLRRRVNKQEAVIARLQTSGQQSRMSRWWSSAQSACSSCWNSIRGMSRAKVFTTAAVLCVVGVCVMAAKRVLPSQPLPWWSCFVLQS